MLIDHIGQFFINTPIILRQIGRISAPLFIFTACIGFKHTKNKIKYLKKLYFFSFLMSVLSAILNFIISSPEKSYITNNFLATLFLIYVFIYIISSTINDKLKRNRYLYFFFLYNLLSVIIHVFLFSYDNHSIFALLSIIPNIIYTEGGILIFSYGVLTYFYQDSKFKLIILNTVISFAILLSGDLNLDFILNVNYQWMMIFSLIFILMYNKNKGKGHKYFFYIFYPMHIAVLFMLSSV